MILKGGAVHEPVFLPSPGSSGKTPTKDRFLPPQYGNNDTPAASGGKYGRYYFFGRPPPLKQHLNNAQRAGGYTEPADDAFFPVKQQAAGFLIHLQSPGTANCCTGATMNTFVF